MRDENQDKGTNNTGPFEDGLNVSFSIRGCWCGVDVGEGEGEDIRSHLQR